MNNRIFTALWIPTWYELDQAVAVGQTDDFWFFSTLPIWIIDELATRPPMQFDHVFYCGLVEEATYQTIRAEVMTITSSPLGAVQRIDTRGLDYTITLGTGTQLTVNAEETPGFVSDERSDNHDWLMQVTLCRR
jgi:hypothetical protein